MVITDALNPILQKSVYVCGNGELVFSYARCDGVIQCKDDSDEQNCSKYTLYSNVQ